MNELDFNATRIDAPTQPGSGAQGAWVASLPKSEPVAVYFDGMTSRKHVVALRFGEALEIIEDGRVGANWAYADMRRADGPPGILRLSSVGAPPLARLEISDEATKGAVIARCPTLDNSSASRQTWRIVAWSVAAACSIVLTALYGIPLVADRLAPLIPFSWEQRFAGTMDNQLRAMFRAKTCTNPDGQRAFAALMDKLKQAGGVDVPIVAEVLSSPVPNAFALPGGRVYLLNGLLDKAGSVDEVAGVLAHELGHIRHRDHLRQVIKNGGTSYLIGLLFGDITGASVVVFAGRSLLEASYSREAEQAADAFAIEIMHRLGRSPRPLGELLSRMSESNGRLEKAMTLMSSHPLTADRLATMKREDRPNSGPEILSASEWRALKAVCRTP